MHCVRSLDVTYWQDEIKGLVITRCYSVLRKMQRLFRVMVYKCVPVLIEEILSNLCVPTYDTFSLIFMLNITFGTPLE